MTTSTQKQGMTLILAERERQVTAEGWTLQHDDDHGHQELENAAFAYRDAEADTPVPAGWPWSESWWKPKDRQRNLVRAGALYLAASQAAERAGDYAARDRLQEQVASCALRLDSLPGPNS